jgi:DNA-binding transcriptional regulator YiaG
MSKQHRVQFSAAGHAPAGEPLHYPECGLDNVYLLNGFQRETIDGQEYLTIDNLDGLWKAIGLHVVANSKLLAPQEVRFLRLQMDMSQAELGRLLRVSDQAVARWEKGKTELPGPADFALRTAFLLSPVSQPEGRMVVDRLLGIVANRTDAEGAPPALAFAQVRDRWAPSEKLAA